MRTLALAGLGIVAVAVLAACDAGKPACFESGATAYQVHAPGAVSLVFAWPRSYKPVKVYAELTGQLPNNTFAALQLWANALHCDELTFEIIPDSTLADIVIRNPTFLPPAPVTGAFFADSVGACKGRTDVLIDSNNVLLRPIRAYVTPNSIDSTALASCYHFVVAHELGHAIGLFSHSPYSGDLMNATPRKTELSINDRYTVQLLYDLSPSVVPAPR